MSETITKDSFIKEVRRLAATDTDKAMAFIDDLIMTHTLEDHVSLILEAKIRKLGLLEMHGRYQECLDLCDQVIQDAYRYREWQMLCRAHNDKGNVYAALGLIDKALDEYLQTMNIGNEYQIAFMSSMAANNIGELYNDQNDLDKAAHYYQLSYEFLDQEQEDDALNKKRLKSTILLNLADVANKRGQGDLALELLDEANEELDVDTDIHLLAHINSVRMTAYAHTGDKGAHLVAYEKAKACYKQLKDHRSLFKLKVDYTQGLVSFDEEAQVLEKILLNALSMPGKEVYIKELMSLHLMLAQLYEAQGNLKASISHYKAYTQVEDQHYRRSLEQQINAMQVKFDIASSHEEKALIEEKNKALSDYSEALIKKTDELEGAYARIQLISQIGQKITSSLDLSEITSSVHQSLKENMPLDMFVMVRLNPEGTHLNQILSNQDFGQRHLNIPIDDPYSIIARCYRDKRMIVYQDFVNDDPAAYQRAIKLVDYDLKSCVYVPLAYNQVVIGVCSVQSRLARAFNQDHIEIIEALSTYLAIAVNNAQKSHELELEVIARLKTQRELEALNAELKSISEFDGLTKVPNRRRFENVYDQMIEVAVNNQTLIHVMMIDIDYFKAYNDHYGHLNGDEVLIKVAQKLNKAFKYQSRLFARYGGEEFVAVIADQSEDQVAVLAQELRIAVSELAIINEHAPTGYLTVSIGLASMVPQSDNDKRDLVATADKMLYKAKDQGRNCVRQASITL